MTVLGLSCRPELSNILPTEKLRTVLRPGGTDPLLFTVAGDRTTLSCPQEAFFEPLHADFGGHRLGDRKGSHNLVLWQPLVVVEPIRLLYTSSLVAQGPGHLPGG